MKTERKKKKNYECSLGIDGVIIGVRKYITETIIEVRSTRLKIWA